MRPIRSFGFTQDVGAAAVFSGRARICCPLVRLTTGQFSPVCDKEYAREQQGRSEPGIKDGDEPCGQPAGASGQDAEGDHQGHYQPPFRIEKGERTPRNLPAPNAAGVLAEQTAEYREEKEGEHDRRPDDAMGDAAGRLAPRHHADTQDIDPRHDPYRAGSRQEEFLVDVKYHLKAWNTANYKGIPCNHQKAGLIPLAVVPAFFFLPLPQNP